MTGAESTPPLLAPLTADEWGDDEYSAFGALLGLPGEQVPRAGSGHAADPLKFDIIGLLARHPKMARRFLTFNGWLLQRGELPVRLREIAIFGSRMPAAPHSSGVSTSRSPPKVVCPRKTSPDSPRGTIVLLAPTVWCSTPPTNC